ncbi:MAG: hypothetical protein ACRC9P_09645 [Bacteroides sp.]
MAKRRLGKRKWIIGGLLIYGILTSLYFLVYSNTPNTMEQYVTMGGFFIIVFILHIVLKKKEEMASRRDDDMKNNKKEEK